MTCCSRSGHCSAVQRALCGWPVLLSLKLRARQPAGSKNMAMVYLAWAPQMQKHLCCCWSSQVEGDCLRSVPSMHFTGSASRLHADLGA